MEAKQKKEIKYENILKYRFFALQICIRNIVQKKEITTEIVLLFNFVLEGDLPAL